MTALPGMMIWWPDYFADTRHLSTIQHGAYFLLIGHYWMHGQLPSDDETLARIVGMRVDVWRRWHRETMMRFFDHGSGTSWRHKRIDAELAKARIRKGRQRDNANKRWQSEANNTDAMAYAKPMPARAGFKTGDSSVPDGTDPDGSPAVPVHTPDGTPAAPVYTDDRHRLWGEGPTLLIAMGVVDKQARKLIGRWLKDTRDDAGRVLDAIQRARDRRVVDAVPWITQALKTDPNPEANHGRRRRESPIATAQRLLARTNGAGGNGHASGASGIFDEAGGGVAVLFPAHRR